ncbi:MAG: polyprenyl synthetase family protein [Paenibacillaceae bacterium]|nr:polyprenyl synthetase family protein [Paenibacillaceae bacterium]
MTDHSFEQIRQYIRETSGRIDQALQDVLPADWTVPAKLVEAMQYSLMAGGKRLRPILLLSVVEAFGTSLDRAMPAACAIELVHTYSMIHDDLPAMDDDDFRRGKPTNHKVFGEAMAILAGDGLLTHAFYCLTQCCRDYGLSAERVLAIVAELAELAGPRGMVGGQAADMEGEQGVTRLDQLEAIHARKTGDLIVFALRAGGHIAEASDEQLAALELYGRKLGLAYQIQDDVLDIVGDESKLGKRCGSDEQQNKVTYPYFLGVEACRQMVAQLTEEGKQALRDARLPDPRKLMDLADYLANRDH